MPDEDHPALRAIHTGEPVRARRGRVFHRRDRAPRTSAARSPLCSEQGRSRGRCSSSGISWSVEAEPSAGAADCSRRSARPRSSLDYAETVSSVARLSVHALADLYFVDLVDENGRVERLAPHVRRSREATADRADGGFRPTTGQGDPAGEGDAEPASRSSSLKSPSLPWGPPPTIRAIEGPPPRRRLGSGDGGAARGPRAEAARHAHVRERRSRAAATPPPIWRWPKRWRAGPPGGRGECALCTSTRSAPVCTRDDFLAIVSARPPGTSLSAILTAAALLVRTLPADEQGAHDRRRRRGHSPRRAADAPDHRRSARRRRHRAGSAVDGEAGHAARRARPRRDRDGAGALKRRRSTWCWRARSAAGGGFEVLCDRERVLLAVFANLIGKRDRSSPRREGPSRSERSHVATRRSSPWRTRGRGSAPTSSLASSIVSGRWRRPRVWGPGWGSPSRRGSWRPSAGGSGRRVRLGAGATLFLLPPLPPGRREPPAAAAIDVELPSRQRVGLRGDDVMTMDIAALRRDTPACASVLHFNNAGSSLPPAVVVDTVVEHLRREATLGGYEAEAEAGERLEAVHGAIARLIGAAPGEIALVENATRAWDMAFYSLRFGPGDRILDRADRVRLELHRVPAGRAAHRRRDRPHPERRARRSIAARARSPARRAGQADRHHPRPHERRARQPGGGDRPPRPVGGRALPARCLPVGGAAADRRRGDRLRSPVGDGARSTCAGRAAPAFSMSGAALHRPAGAAAPRSPRGALDGAGPLRAAARRPALRELGELCVAGRLGPRRGRGVCAPAGPAGDPRPGGCAGRAPARAALRDPGGHRARPRRAALRHRDLHSRRRGRRGHQGAARRAGDPCQRIDRRGDAARLRGSRDSRSGCAPRSIIYNNEPEIDRFVAALAAT